MENINKEENSGSLEKEKKDEPKPDSCCCYVVDPCGSCIDLCGCYVDPCRCC